MFTFVKNYNQMRFYQFIAFAFICLISTASCWREANPDEGLVRHRDKYYRYNIDYPDNSCKASIDNQASSQVLTIVDNDRNYRIQVLALKAEQDKRYKFDYYSNIDTSFSKCGELQSESKDWLNDRITRTYSVNQYITMETTSIYGGNIVYVIYSEFNEQGESEANKIKESFKTSSCIGPVNFCKRKLYSIAGDNLFSTVVSYLIFSILFTILFWAGIIVCFKPNDPLIVILSVAAFIVTFAAFAATDQFMGYIYGHNNLWHIIQDLLFMFCDEG